MKYMFFMNKVPFKDSALNPRSVDMLCSLCTEGGPRPLCGVEVSEGERRT